MCIADGIERHLHRPRQRQGRHPHDAGGPRTRRTRRSACSSSRRCRRPRPIRAARPTTHSAATATTATTPPRRGYVTDTINANYKTARRSTRPRVSTCTPSTGPTPRASRPGQHVLQRGAAPGPRRAHRTRTANVPDYIIFLTTARPTSAASTARRRDFPYNADDQQPCHTAINRRQRLQGAGRHLQHRLRARSNVNCTAGAFRKKTPRADWRHPAPARHAAGCYHYAGRHHESPAITSYRRSRRSPHPATSTTSPMRPSSTRSSLRSRPTSARARAGRWTIPSKQRSLLFRDDGQGLTELGFTVGFLCLMLLAVGRSAPFSRTTSTSPRPHAKAPGQPRSPARPAARRRPLVRPPRRARARSRPRTRRASPAWQSRSRPSTWPAGAKVRATVSAPYTLSLFGVAVTSGTMSVSDVMRVHRKGAPERVRVSEPARRRVRALRDRLLHDRFGLLKVATIYGHYLALQHAARAARARAGHAQFGNANAAASARPSRPPCRMPARSWIDPDGDHREGLDSDYGRTAGSGRPTTAFRSRLPTPGSSTCRVAGLVGHDVNDDPGHHRVKVAGSGTRLQAELRPARQQPAAARHGHVVGLAVAVSTAACSAPASQLAQRRSPRLGEDQRTHGEPRLARRLLR